MARKADPVNPGSKRVAIYARTSTAGQDTGNQLEALRGVAERSGWEVVAEYVDQGVSGAKGRNRRPEFDRMLRDATARRFDVVAAFSLDRLGRSMQHLVHFLGEVRALGVGLYVHDQHLDTSTPMGEMLFHVAGAFAQFERRLIQERVRAGLARTKKRLGRPPKATPAVRRRIVAARRAGKSIRQVAREVGVSAATVHAVVSEGAGTDR